MQRSELGRVVKRARDRLTPAAVGLAAGTHRRVPGLRREEVALLAGISVDYVARLEQGRGPRPSAQVLTALARALRLGDDERAELFHLAGSTPPGPDQIALHVRPTTLRLIDRLADLPTMVLSAKGDVLAWNAMSSALHGDWSTLPPRERNLNRLRFLGTTGPGMRTRVVVAEDERRGTAVQAVGSLRAAYARYPRDAGLTELLRDLRSGSPQFVELWDAGGASTWRSQRKTFDHPALGILTLDCDIVLVPDLDQAIVAYSAEPGSPEAEALGLLRVLGLQEVAGAPDRSAVP